LNSLWQETLDQPPMLLEIPAPAYHPWLCVRGSRSSICRQMSHVNWMLLHHWSALSYARVYFVLNHEVKYQTWSMLLLA